MLQNTCEHKSIDNRINRDEPCAIVSMKMRPQKCCKHVISNLIYAQRRPASVSIKTLFSPHMKLNFMIAIIFWYIHW